MMLDGAVLVEVEDVSVVDSAVVIRRDVGVACDSGWGGISGWHRLMMHDGAVDITHDGLAYSKLWCCRRSKNSV